MNLDRWNWDWEHAWGVLIFSVIFSVLVCGLVAWAHPHDVDYYYLTASGSNNTVCVEQHWTWHTDGQAYCTDDIAKALDVLAKANATLRKK